LSIRAFNELNGFVCATLQINPRLYRVKDYTKGFVEAMSNNTYLETVSKSNCPSTDSCYRYINRADINIFREVFKSFVKDLKDLLKGYRKIYISIDTHYESYYGMKRDYLEHIHAYRKDKGSTGSYKYIVATISTKDISIILDCDILTINDSLINYVDDILNFCINELEINPRHITVLTDREFKNFDIIKLFEQYGCNYLCFVPKNDRIKY